MQNKFTSNIKNILSALFKVLCLILFARYMVFIDMKFSDFVFECTEKIFQKGEMVFIAPSLITQYIRVIIEYAVAKRLGIIQFLNKQNFFLSLLYILIMEVFIVAQQNYYDDYLRADIDAPTTMFLQSLFFFRGFLYTFLVYRFIRFLSNKFKTLKFLKKFYPKILDKIPSLLVLIIISIFAYPYGKYLWGEKIDIGDITFLYSTEVLLVIIVVYTVFATIKALCDLYKKNKTD